MHTHTHTHTHTQASASGREWPLSLSLSVCVCVCVCARRGLSSARAWPPVSLSVSTPTPPFPPPFSPHTRARTRSVDTFRKRDNKQIGSAVVKPPAPYQSSSSFKSSTLTAGEQYYYKVCVVLCVCVVFVRRALLCVCVGVGVCSTRLVSHALPPPKKHTHTTHNPQQSQDHGDGRDRARRARHDAVADDHGRAQAGVRECAADRRKLFDQDRVRRPRRRRAEQQHGAELEEPERRVRGVLHRRDFPREGQGAHRHGDRHRDHVYGQDAQRRRRVLFQGALCCLFVCLGAALRRVRARRRRLAPRPQCLHMPRARTPTTPPRAVDNNNKHQPR